MKLLTQLRIQRWIMEKQQKNNMRNPVNEFAGFLFCVAKIFLVDKRRNYSKTIVIHMWIS